MINIHCDNCGRKFNVPESGAGKSGRCPNCRQVVVVPILDDNNSFTDRSGVEGNSKVSGIDSSLFDIPQMTQTTEKSIPQQYIPGKSFESSNESNESMEAEGEKPEEVTKSRLPWFVDIFLYPFNLAGVLNLISLWLLIFLLCPLIMAGMGLGIEYIPVVYLLPVAYMLYYFTECLRDSAAGHRRAVDLWGNPVKADKWDYISQLLIVVGSVAVCFWPMAVYYIATERADLIYWLLLASGGFFFPMVLLAVVLFDSFGALNPILIIGSIIRTLLPYCGLVLFFYASALLFMEIDSPVNRFWLLPLVPFLIKVVQLYMIFIAVGLLGRFYHRYEKKLNWEV
jgi:hypothetical protein